MNDLDTPPLLKGPPPRPALPAPDHDAPEAPPTTPEGRGGSGRRLFGLGVLVLFMAALALGVWRHYAQHRQVVDTAEQQANFVPNVHVEAVAPRLGKLHVSLPGTTLAFEAANIYARASGYVYKRYVDIGDHVKAGQLLAEIDAPDLDQQIMQAEADLTSAVANLTLAETTLERGQSLITSGAVSKQTLDQRAADAQNRSPESSFLPNTLNSGPAWSTKVVPS